MKYKTTRQLLIFAAIFASVIIFSSCTDNNWPQFRGPAFNAVTTSLNLPTGWGKDTNVLWIYDFEGNSWSSPIVWGDKVFISTAFGVKAKPIEVFQSRPESRPADEDTSRAGIPRPGQERTGGGPQPGSAPTAGQERPQGPPPPPPPPEAPDTSYMEEIYRWEVTCLDLNTGNVLWKQVAFEGNPRGRKNPAATYANETPVTDGKRVYVHFGTLGLFCFDMEGKLLWKKDLGVYETLNGWGTGSSPVVYKNIVYQKCDNESGSFMIALDAATGEEIWKAERDEKTTYSTPVIWENSIRTELVTNGKTRISYDLKTGKVLWQSKNGGDMCIPSPVPDQDRLYLSNNGGRETPGTLCMVKAGAEGDITPAPGTVANEWIEWANPQAGTGNPTPLVYKGLIYIIASRGGEVTCFNALTGKQVYKEKVEKAGGSWASPWAAGDHIGFVDERGLTTLIKAGEKFEVVAQNKLDDRVWASPAIAGDKYVFKGAERLYCVGN